MITSILLIIVSILNFIIFLLVFNSARNRLYARYFSYFILASIIWIISNYFIDIFLDYNSVLFVSKITFSSVSVMATSLLMFAIYYPKKVVNLGKIVEGCILVTGLFISGLSFTPWIVEGVIFNPIANEIKFGPLSSFYFITILVYLILSIGFIVKSYRSFKGKLRVQLQYLFLGILLFLFFSSTTNIFMPTVFNNFNLSAAGPFSVFFMIFFTAYAIIRHRLMDIRFLVVRSLTYLLLLIFFGFSYMVTIFVFGGLIFGQFTGKEAYWASMVVSLLVGFTFYPLKRIFTKWTDKIFFKDRYDFETLTSKLNETATSTIILAELLFKFLNLLTEEMRVARGAFVLLERGKVYDTQTLGYKKTVNLSAQEIDHLVKEKKIEIYDEAEEDSFCKEIMRKYDATIVLPLVVEHELIGVLFLGEKKSGDAYTTKDIDVLKIVSNQLALGIQNAKSYEQAQKFNLILRGEVNRATKELKDANSKLQELDKSKDEFISLASHEIRTPIATLEGYLSILTNPRLKKKDQKDILDRAYEGVERLAVLAKDLLDTSRIDQDRLIINKEAARIETIIDRSVEGFELRAKDKGIFVKRKKGSSLLPEVSMDQERMSEVLNNLIGNAIKFTQTGGITVSAELQDKKTVIVAVSDTGEGIPKDDIPNLFKKFYQAQTASSILSKDKGGTGLGLYITKKIIDLHEGKIWVESHLRRGTTFYFTLPVK